MKKSLKLEKIPFNEIYLSKLLTVEKMIGVISDFYEEKKQRARIWLDNDVVNQSDYELTLEEYGMSDGSFVYIEFADQNN